MRFRTGLIFILAVFLPSLHASAGESVPSFNQDIVPILTRAGCNSGGCHGKGAGQNGFRLSLRGYAPEQDYLALTRDLRTRRVEFADPAASLVVRKATGAAPHEGGKRFSPGSRYDKTLQAWIAARAPGPVAAEPDAAELRIIATPGTLKVGDTRSLQVIARYPDGKERDVTWLARFISNDEATVKVGDDGQVQALRNGESAVRAHFQNLVAVALFTMPFESAVPADAYPATSNIIDEAVFEKLKALNIPASPVCDDATFIRRAFLDAAGVLPSADEVRAFVADKNGDKRRKLVDQLLDRPEWIDYWTLQLSDLLQNRKERDHDVRGAKGVRSFHAWLRGQVAQNRPWNELARDILLASGDNIANPQIGYYIVTVGEKNNIEESEVVDSVAQAFLGTRIGCARCHNHPLERYTQDDFYHFAAFFSRMNMKRQESTKGPTSLITETREETNRRQQVEETRKKLVEAEAEAKGKTGEELKKADAKVTEHKKRLEKLNKEIAEIRKQMPEVRQPRTSKMMDARPLDRSAIPIATGQDPRAALVSWMIDPKNESFSGAMANRLWRHFMGFGLIEPVDDLRSSNPPTNPKLWRILNDEFVSHGYDLKHLMRLIMTSQAYGLSFSTLAGNETDRKFHSHYYARRLPAEVLLDAVSSATGIPDSFAGYPTGLRATQIPDPSVSSYFLGLFGRSDRVTACACERSGEVTLPQLLHLHNGQDLIGKLRNSDGRLSQLMKMKLDDAKMMEEIFLLTLARQPRESEIAAITASLKAGDAKEDVYRDLFWALLNSKEFAFNH